METLALIELLDRDGQPRQSLRVTAWPIRIGRAIDCDVVLDDPHVAAHHADLVAREDGVHIEPAPSVNGVRLGRAKIVSGSRPLLPASSLIGIGGATLRVRLATEALAAEQPLADVHLGGGKRAVGLVVLAVIAALWAAFNQWLTSTPGESGTQMTGLYLAAPVGLVVWCCLWALGSKLFQRQFAFWPHLQAALFWPLLAMVAETLSGQLAFAFSMPLLAKAGHLLAVAALVMLLWRHLSIVLPQRRQSFAWVMAGLVVVGGGLDVAERARHQQPWVGSLYLGTISLPALRVVKPVSADAFVQSAQPLEKTLSHWSKASGDESEPESSDDD
jgi:pSer/pThr/pTyr-binding forkhead associated (FHA) protein